MTSNDHGRVIPALCGVLTNPSPSYTPARRFALKVLLQMSQPQPTGLGLGLGGLRDKDKQTVFVAHDSQAVRCLLKAALLDIGSEAIIYGTIINLTGVQEIGAKLPFAEILTSLVNSLRKR